MACRICTLQWEWPDTHLQRCRQTLVPQSPPYSSGWRGTPRTLGLECCWPVLHAAPLLKWSLYHSTGRTTIHYYKRCILIGLKHTRKSTLLLKWSMVLFRGIQRGTITTHGGYQWINWHSIRTLRWYVFGSTFNFWTMCTERYLLVASITN